MYDNEYYGAPNDYRNYLSHHGIKGQKWGVMHGPPYPLGSHTSAMIKNGKKVAAKAKKTYDKKIKPKVNDLAKKGSDFYEKNMPEKGKQAINKVAKKTKEVYEVNKELAKKGISNYKSNYDSTKNDLKAKSVLSGTDTPKEDVKEPLDTSKMTEWEKKTIKGGYVVNNPSGFEKGTTLTHRDYKSFSSDTWEVDDADTHIVIDRTIWDKDALDKMYKNKKFIPKEASKKEIISLQKSLIKNNSKIVNDVIDSIADNIASESNNDWFPEEHRGKSKSDFAEMIKNDIGASIRAVPVKVPNGDGYTVEVTVGDGFIYNGHILTKEVYFDPTTGKYRITTPDGYQMDG